jgi:endonuclease/exonuclease/phosphatase family metal-dependent hydrolase
MLRALDADVWCLQETTKETADEFAAALGYRLVSASYKNKIPASASGNSGVCVLLRQSLLPRLIKSFQADQSNNKAPMAGLTLRLGGARADLTIITTHLVMNFPHINEGLAELHSTLVTQGIDYNSTVLIGDFNADNMSSSQDLDNFCAARGLDRSLMCFPTFPDQLMTGSAVPRLAIGVCSEVPTLAMHVEPRGQPRDEFKIATNLVMMEHRKVVSDHVPLGFIVPAVVPDRSDNQG